ncbi:MAG: hypothetical protein KDA49_00940, partial [Rhodospirillaceae bacterium]|nr:hypothetical protein [Rhodospirillaceae bacterium]
MPARDAPVTSVPPSGRLLGASGWFAPGPQTLLFALYCAVFFALRVWLSHGMEQDAATRFLHSQVLSLAYGGNDPPLYTWALTAMQRLVGTGLQAVLLIN